MGDIVRRLVWFFFVSGVLAYSVFLIGGGFINAQAVSASRIVSVRDELQPGVHHLSGMVMVHSTCAQLSVSDTELSSSTIQLNFTTWMEPSVPCVEEDTPRAFRSVVFAPAAGVQFLGSLDGDPLTIVVVHEKASH
ncbi:MAG: hypothetical protein JO019_00050 [Candidatus Kaiserbacteria bacterium]|nr:hypothetical protein [Candidatus Kaiserbacteria bacterium]